MSSEQKTHATLLSECALSIMLQLSSLVGCSSWVFMQTAIFMYVCRPLKHVLDVQGYGVELPVHRAPHVPTGRASAGLGSDQVSIAALHLNPAAKTLCELSASLLFTSNLLCKLCVTGQHCCFSSQPCKFCVKCAQAWPCTTKQHDGRWG